MGVACSSAQNASPVLSDIEHAHQHKRARGHSRPRGRRAPSHPRSLPTSTVKGTPPVSESTHVSTSARTPHPKAHHHHGDVHPASVVVAVVPAADSPKLTPNTPHGGAVTTRTPEEEEVDTDAVEEARRHQQENEAIIAPTPVPKEDDLILVVPPKIDVPTVIESKSSVVELPPPVIPIEEQLAPALSPPPLKVPPVTPLVVAAPPSWVGSGCPNAGPAPLSFGVHQARARQLECDMEDLLNHPPLHLSLTDLPSSRPRVPRVRVAPAPVPSWTPFPSPRYTVSEYAADGTPILVPPPPRRKLHSVALMSVCAALRDMSDAQLDDLACHRVQQTSGLLAPARSPTTSCTRAESTGHQGTPAVSPLLLPVPQPLDSVGITGAPLSESLAQLEYRLNLLAAKSEWAETRERQPRLSLFGQDAYALQGASRETTMRRAEIASTAKMMPLAMRPGTFFSLLQEMNGTDLLLQEEVEEPTTPPTPKTHLSIKIDFAHSELIEVGRETSSYLRTAHPLQIQTHSAALQSRTSHGSNGSHESHEDTDGAELPPSPLSPIYHPSTHAHEQQPTPAAPQHPLDTTAAHHFHPLLHPHHLMVGHMVGPSHPLTGAPIGMYLPQSHPHLHLYPDPAMASSESPTSIHVEEHPLHAADHAAAVPTHPLLFQ